MAFGCKGVLESVGLKPDLQSDKPLACGPHNPVKSHASHVRSEKENCMSLLALDSLLEPVAADAPCGRDMEYEPAFLELLEMARGKPEQVIGDKVKPGQEPAWPKVRAAAEALFGSTKDLRVAGVLHLALLKTAGIAGLESGLGLIRGLLERYWDNLYPLLDADDDNDPTFRVNSLLAALVSEEAMGTLRIAPLVESRQFGKHSLRAHRIATGALKIDPETQAAEQPADLGRIEAAFSDATAESLSGMAGLLNTAAEHMNALQHILLDKADGIPDDLKSLASDLKEMKGLLDAQLAKRGVNSGAQETVGQGSDGGQAAAPAGGTAASGEIRNRSDVLATIDRICAYYARAEPSSPIPMLLLRAKRLVNKDFMEIIRDLTPSAVAEAEVIGGLEKRDS
jgi:type VI secretion system protein ImpA